MLAGSERPPAAAMGRTMPGVEAADRRVCRCLDRCRRQRFLRSTRTQAATPARAAIVIATPAAIRVHRVERSPIGDLAVVGDWKSYAGGTVVGMVTAAVVRTGSFALVVVVKQAATFLHLTQQARQD